MFNQYCGIQAEQIKSQNYEYTQDTRLIVYAPKRCKLLKSSFEVQLHDNYRLVSSLSEIGEEKYDGVIVVAEDGELTSCAMMYYAKAIASGADFAYSDAVFGPCGTTQCLWSDSAKEVSGNIVGISRDLFLKTIKEVSDETDAHAIINSACAAASRVERIPYALVAHRRSIHPTDVFSVDKKRVLVLSHEFSMTGAPIVLVSAVPVLKSMGYDVVVLGPEFDSAASLFLDAGATVLANKERLANEVLYGLALSCDLVIANTIVEVDDVNQLRDSSVPVLWWLHDAFFGYKFIESHIPSKNADNIKVYAVGKHATAAMHSIRPSYEIGQLLYGLPDYSKEPYEKTNFLTDNKLLFASVGSLEERKGQDVLAQAISLLSKTDRSKARFLFVGRCIDKAQLDAVEELVEKYPDNVTYIERLSRDEIKSLMEQVSGVICSSRDDPMPTFVTEAAMFGKPAIVSEHTGTAGLVTHGKDGFVYKNDDPKELTKIISQVIKEPQKLKSMSKDCRAFYENNFTKEVFEKTLSSIINKIVD